MGAPTSRLHGPSEGGWAGAPASGPAGPAPSAPAGTAPRASSARRSIRPLPATNSNGGDFPAALRILLLMAFLLGDCAKHSSAWSGREAEGASNGDCWAGTTFLAPLAGRGHTATRKTKFRPGEGALLRAQTRGNAPSSRPSPRARGEGVRGPASLKQSLVNSTGRAGFLRPRLG